MRLITRGDWDGLVCAVLLKESEHIEEISFAHPKDMQDGKVAARGDDIIANLPYVPGCAMWFDHHVSEEARLQELPDVPGRYDVAPSAARLIYEYYRGDKPDLENFAELVEATDRIDSARLTVEDVIEPKGYVLLSYTIDPRTGLGQWRDYFLKMVDWLRERNLGQVLAIDEVQERATTVIRQQEACLQAFRQYSRREANMVITDFRDLDEVPPGNRFLVYALYPKANVSARIFWGRNKEQVVVALGHSIFNRTCKVDLGRLLREYGGGGHRGAGTCQFDTAQADDKLTELLARLREE